MCQRTSHSKLGRIQCVLGTFFSSLAKQISELLWLLSSATWTPGNIDRFTSGYLGLFSLSLSVVPQFMKYSWWTFEKTESDPRNFGNLCACWASVNVWARLPSFGQRGVRCSLWKVLETAYCLSELRISSASRTSHDLRGGRTSLILRRCECLALLKTD